MPQHKTTKRAASGMGSIRKTQRIVNGKVYTYYEARYTVGFHPGTGKQIQKSITGKTQKEVSQKLKAIESSLDTGNYIEPCKMSVSEWLDLWVSGYLRNLKPLTEKTYIRSGHIASKARARCSKIEGFGRAYHTDILQLLVRERAGTENSKKYSWSTSQCLTTSRFKWLHSAEIQPMRASSQKLLDLKSSH